MELREQLEKQLERAPETDVMGVVSAGGVSGGSGASPTDPWTLLVSFSGWRQCGGALQESELTLRKEVALEEINRVQKRVRPFDVLRVRVRLATENAFGSPQALITGSLEKEDSDAELLTYARKLQEPVTFRDPQFGLFTLDRQVNWYESSTQWGLGQIRLTVDAKESQALELSLAVARSLWGSQQGWQQRITDYATGKLLPLKNESWLDEGETELTAPEFARRMVLESITIRADGSFEFWYEDGDLFWGHSIMVSGNLTEGPTHAGIEG